MKPKTRRDALALLSLLRDHPAGQHREGLCDVLGCSDGRLSYLIKCARALLPGDERIVFLWATWRGISWTRWKIVKSKPRQMALGEVAA